MSTRSVFISSTFRDMQAERDVLSRLVLPRLRKEVPDAAGLVEIDLRWGLTRAMTADDGAVRLCLERVDAADCVLGMLGARIGWQPDPSFVRAFDLEFASRVPPDCGLTELELRRATMIAHRGRPPPRVLIRNDPETTAAHHTLLAWLRERHPNCLRTYAGSADFEAQALKALRELVSATGEPPEDQTAPPQVPRPAVEAIVARAIKPSRFCGARPVLVHSPSGAGLSALLKTAMAERPDSRCIDGRMAANGRFLDNAARAALLTDIPVLIDHFEDGFATPERATLSALPELSTGRSRPQIVVATHLQRLATEAADLGWRVATLPAPTPDEASGLAKAFLDRYGKTLEPGALETLRRAPWITNLTATVFALHELRRHGEMESLSKRLAELAGHVNTGSLAGDVVAALDDVLPEAHRGSVARIVSALAASLRGIGAAEVPRLAGEVPLPSAYWGILRETLGPGLIERGALIDVSSGPLLAWAIERAEARPNLHADALKRVRALAADGSPEVARAHPVLLFRAEGPETLARHLADPETAATLAAESPEFFAGCLDLLPSAGQIAVTEAWAESGVSGDGAMRLASEANRVGAKAAARLILARTDNLAGNMEAQVVLRATILGDPDAARAVLDRLVDETRPSNALVSAALGLFADGTAPLDRVMLARVVGRLSQMDGSGGSAEDDARLQVLLGQCYLLLVVPKAAAKRFATAASAARRMARAQLLCLALERGAAAAIEIGRFRRARALAEECREIAARSGLGRLESLAYCLLTTIAARRAEWAQAYALNTEHHRRVKDAAIDAPDVPERILTALEHGTLR
jgi:Domain of unknown function (DUF4062)